MKLKRKLIYRGHFYFEVTRPNTLHNALLHLKQSNSLYHDIAIVLGKIPDSLLSLSEHDCKKIEKVHTKFTRNHAVV